MKSSIKDPLDKAFEVEEWEAARRLIRKRQKADPTDHWLITRLATTFYEQRNYARALECSEKAVALAPDCPLVLWDYAGALDMMNRVDEAISIWLRLIKRGVENIAFDECGEGVRWAESLVNDCRYRLAASYYDLGKAKEALEFLEDHLRHRRRGLPSIYSLREARGKLRDWRGPQHTAKELSA